MAIVPRVNVITLGVSDVSLSTKFYESLGWVRSSVSEENITFIQLGAIVLGLYEYSMLAQDATIPPGDRQVFPSFTVAINADSRQEVDEIIEQAREAGAEIVKEPQEVFWGGYSSYFADPDGFLWEVAHNPFFEKDQQGYVSLPH